MRVDLEAMMSVAIEEAKLSRASVWANVSAIVYGASIEETARLGKARIECLSEAGQVT